MITNSASNPERMHTTPNNPNGKSPLQKGKTTPKAKKKTVDDKAQIRHQKTVETSKTRKKES